MQPENSGATRRKIFTYMNISKDSRDINRLVLLALAVSLVSLTLFITVEETSSDTSTAFWLVLLVLLYFVSLPVHGLLLIIALLKLVQGSHKKFQWLYIYLFLAIVGYAVVGANYGAFDGITNDLMQYKLEVENPAQVKLERALSRGPVSNITIVRESLAEGADPNGTIFDNRMPLLILAAGRADIESIKALLDAGADPKKRSSITHAVQGPDIENASALDLALRSKYGDVAGSVKFLIAAGSELTTANNLGQQPLDVAIESYQYEAALYIAKGGGKAANQTSIEHVMQSDLQDIHLEELRNYLRGK